VVLCKEAGAENMSELNYRRMAARRAWLGYLLGFLLFAVCYLIAYVLSLSLYVNVVRSVLIYEGVLVRVSAYAVVPCIASLITVFIGTAFHVICSCRTSRIFLIVSLLALIVTYYSYLHFIISSRKISVCVLPLFNLLSNSKQAVLSLDLGQIGLLGIIYLLRHEIRRLLRRRV